MADYKKKYKALKKELSETKIKLAQALADIIEVHQEYELKKDSAPKVSKKKSGNPVKKVVIQRVDKKTIKKAVKKSVKKKVAKRS